jgi:hypothetical protein
MKLKMNVEVLIKSFSFWKIQEKNEFFVNIIIVFIGVSEFLCNILFYAKKNVTYL